ncbi:MAG: hypothetical protein ACJAXX_000446 [Roseivirga sp.]|jgi:hypothetical protein
MAFFNRINKKNKLPTGNQQSQLDLFIKGSFFGLLFLSLSFMAIGAIFFRSGYSLYLQIPAYLIAGILAFYVFRWLGSALHLFVREIPTVAVSLVLATVFTFYLADYMHFGWSGTVLTESLTIAISALVLFTGSLMNLLRGKRNKSLYSLLMLIGVAGIAAPVYFLIDEGSDPFPIDFKPTVVETLSEMGISNPAEVGSYGFDFFTYGSGTDERRPEYGAQVKVKTASVDGTLIIPEWKGKKKKYREKYWGFGLTEFPINGRTWMPKKEGKSPLILIVHGNHSMEHYSDPGYAYLGEMLASKGYITVSVDENFINGTWSGDFGGKEMPARAWFLLKHLSQWREWNNDQNSEFYQKVDLDNVILMGHSRGGEAVSIAAAYNKLSYFPDDANLTFDFNFGIQGIVTIAPTDARYFRRIELENINYFSIQGAYDADEASFFGLRQYQRITNNDSLERIKAGLYVHQANHGQFNSIWGRNDFGGTSGWFLNTAPLLQGEDQRSVAKTYIGAFTDIVFNQKKEYLPLLKNAMVASDWLPSVVYVNNFQSSADSTLVDYEEDIDLETTLSENITISSENLDIWYEQELQHRDKSSQGKNGVVIGWNNDSTQSIKKYRLHFNTPFSMASSSTLLFSLARAEDSKIKLEGNEDLNFTIRLIANDSLSVSTELYDHKKIAPKIRVKYMKIDKMSSRLGDNWELAMETFEIPFDSFSADPALSYSAIELVFDQSPKGVIAIDKIGLRR